MKRTCIGAGLAMWLLAVSAVGAGEHSLTVEVIPAAGGAPLSIDPSQLQVLADGEPLEVSGRPVAAPWRVSLLMDQRLSEPRAIRNAAVDLSELADRLVALGPVEIMLGREELTRAALPTRDPDALRQALSWIRVRETGEAAQFEVRRRFGRDFELAELAERPYAAVSAFADQTLAELRLGVRQAIEEEIRIIEGVRRLLLEWAVENRSAGPALLIIVTSGEDDVLRYYQETMAELGMPEVLEGVSLRPARPTRSAVARALSSLGWVTVVYTPEGADALLQGELPGQRQGDEQVETVVQDGKIVERTVFTPRFDPRDLLRRKKIEQGRTLEARLLDPFEVSLEIAEATGGDIAISREGLDEILSRLQTRAKLRIVDDSGSYAERSLRVLYPPAGEGGAFEVRSRRWISLGTPQVVAETRARRLLEDGIEEGPLLVTAQTGERDGLERLAVEVESPDQGPNLGAGPLRVTIGTVDRNDQALFEHRMVFPGARETSESGSVIMESELPLAPVDGNPLVVLVEDLESGRWGGAYATYLGGLAGSLQASLRMTPRQIHLLRPEASMLVGPTLFETIHDAEVARVVFVLDGDLVVERTSLPFSARLDLGELPEPHRVEVIAYDAAGRELGRDRLALNESGGIFRVRIVRPTKDRRESGQPLVGPVVVEAAIDAPRTSPVERVEFFWNQELVATRFAKPYAQRVPVPRGDPQGFFRVVAWLEDGSTAEDVLFVNSPGGSERVKVELVQLYTVVTDREGRPVQGLGADSFRVLEEGREQEIATFNEASDQPLTVGLAIDTSASMFVKLPRVQKAASGFLEGLDGDKDRAFVVDFGSDPRLFHDTSRDLEAVEASLLDLEPGGQTAIWKGISFALVQLQGIQGKKALIVFSDGADEDPDFSYRTCLKFARRVGVPVYVIVSNDEIHRTGGRGLNVRGFINRLESLTRAVGGRVYFSRVGEDLAEIYALIDKELRSQYMLGYYAQDQGEGRWRSVRVDVDEPGARARTIAGYFR